MTTPTITVTPDPLPNRGQGKTAFNDAVDSYMTWLEQNADELNVLIPWIVQSRDEVIAAALAGQLPSLTGQALRFLQVNAAETGLQMQDLLEIPDPVGQDGRVLGIVGGVPAYVEKGPSGSKVLLQTGAMADIIELTSLMDPALYVGYEIEYYSSGQVTGGTDGGIQTSGDNGVTWDSGATDYAWRYGIQGGDGSGTVINSADGEINFTSGISNDGTGTVHNKITIMRPDLTEFTAIEFTYRKMSSSTGTSGGITALDGVGFRMLKTAINAVRLIGLNGTGTITGTYYFYGIRA